MEIILDGSLINNREELFESLKKQIDSDEFYGNNLDALWDVLTSFKKPIIVKLNNRDLLSENLGEYFNSLLQLFNDLKDITII